MFVPLHYQVSEYDCVPTAFTNALSCLFERHEVPPMVVRHIYAYSLDTVARGARLGRKGTSSAAVRLLGHWLASYRTGRFALFTEYLQGMEVHLGAGSLLLRCVEERGVALLNIRLSRGEEHFVTAVSAQEDWVLCWDPYCRTTLRGLKDRARVLPTDGRTPNLAVRRDWMDSDDIGRRFSLGPVEDREALLLWRGR